MKDCFQSFQFMVVLVNQAQALSISIQFTLGPPTVKQKNMHACIWCNEGDLIQWITKVNGVPVSKFPLCMLHSCWFLHANNIKNCVVFSQFPSSTHNNIDPVLISLLISLKLWVLEHTSRRVHTLLITVTNMADVHGCLEGRNLKTCGLENCQELRNESVKNV